MEKKKISYSLMRLIAISNLVQLLDVISIHFTEAHSIALHNDGQIVVTIHTSKQVETLHYKSNSLGTRDRVCKWTRCSCRVG